MVLPDIDEIVRFQPPVYASVPSRACVAWAYTLDRVLDQLVSNDPNRWHLFFLLARLVLRVPLASEGSPAEIVASRCRRFTHDGFRNVAAMWREVVESPVTQPLHSSAYYSIDTPSYAHMERLNTLPPLSAVTHRRVSDLITQGFYARAVQALSPARTAQCTQPALDALSSLHPQGENVGLTPSYGPNIPLRCPNGRP
jgi:acyl transferase domain-containing protein